MPTFLSLPYEIRQIIYDHALIVGTIAPFRHACAAVKDPYSFNPFTQPSYEYATTQIPISEELPNINLLKTCRLIHAEASPTLYSKNVWVLPMTEWAVNFFANALYNDERRAWVKRVYLYLQVQDMSVAERQAVAAETRLKLASEYKFLGWDCNACRAYLRTTGWPRKVKLILEYLALDFLAVNFYWSTFPGASGNMGVSALVAFADGFKYRMPAHLETYGLAGFRKEVIESMFCKWTEQRHAVSIPLSKGISENGVIIQSLELIIDWEGNIRKLNAT